ncbi:ribosome biogenesis GTPase A [Clostridia bacterium]|nr:ribosome biogenesis GTPase A [Clostridia bacterium]
MQIQWYPGHMAKSLRLIEENLKLVDIVLYVLDARVPRSSFNPAFNKLLNGKPVVYILNKADLAEEKATAAWLAEYAKIGTAVKLSANRTNAAKDLPALCRRILSEKLARYAVRGVKYSVKAMIIGVPNCGKSTLINNLTRTASAKVGNMPGVTRGKQWLKAGEIDLLDTPGVLWSDLKDQETARHLACAGCIKDDILDTVQLSKTMLGELYALGGGTGVEKRYGLQQPSEADAPAEAGLSVSIGVLFDAIAKRRGCIGAGGVLDAPRCAAVILEDFRTGKFGRITLEKS